MPLESANYLTDLVTSNPAPSDPLSNADDHMRLIKATIKATFPNFTSAALQSTQAQIDAATLAVDTNGITLLADAGVNFKTNTTDKITNPAAGEVDVVTGGAVAARFMATSAIFSGTLAATGGHVGPGAAPIGAIMIWPFDTLPSGFGVWAWCNGGTVSRTTYPAYQTLCAAASYPYGAGDGTTTVGVPNYQEVTLVGKSGMGGATSPGLLTSIASGVKTVLGSLFGSDTHTQTIAEMPTHFHSAGIYDPGHSHSTNAVVNTNTAGVNTGGAFAAPYNMAAASIGTAGTGVLVNGGANGNGSTYSTGNGNAFNITQPSRITNFIIRVA